MSKLLIVRSGPDAGSRLELDVMEALGTPYVWWWTLSLVALPCTVGPRHCRAIVKERETRDMLVHSFHPVARTDTGTDMQDSTRCRL